MVTFVDRKLPVAEQQCEELPPSLVVFTSSSVLLPGRRSPRSHPAPLREGVQRRALRSSAARQSLLPGSGRTERRSFSAAATGPATSDGAAGEEAPSLQGSMSAQVPRELPVPRPPAQPAEPPGFVPPASSL